MNHFYLSSNPAPLDQADGLRRLFASRSTPVLALAANPHVPFAGLALDHLVSALAAQGHHVMVVDAASTSPQPHDLAHVDLAACIEKISHSAHYLPARGLAMSYVDTRGSASAFITAVQQAALQVAPKTNLLLLHADAPELARLLKSHSTLAPTRPMLLGADHSESIKHAYASAKLLAKRCELLGFDLLLVGAPHASRLRSIANSLGDCLENFLGAALHHTALIDPAANLHQRVDEALHQLLTAQLASHDEPAPVFAPPSFAPDNARFDTPRSVSASRTAFR
jgi:hypothetical protein